MIFDKDGKPGLRIESAASVTLRGTLKSHMEIFAHVIQHDHAAGQSVAAAYIDGLAGTLALIIAKQGDAEGITDRTIKTLREAIQRDLRHLRRG